MKPTPAPAPTQPPRPDGSGGLAAPIAVCVAALAMFHAAAVSIVGPLDLGSTQLPSARQAQLLVLWLPLGLIAAGALGWALTATARMRRIPIAPERAPRDRAFVAAVSMGAAGLALLMRQVVLLGAQLTDDESAYLFMARLLDEGRIYADSPPMKLFFDRAFLVNDGRMYSQYFLGWPLLLAPGVRLGMAGAMNAVYLGLTVPVLFWLVRRHLGSFWARVAALLLATSPFVLLVSASMLSHTGCLLAMTLVAALALRAGDRDSRPWHHAALAAAFSLGFFIRPTVALGVGAPFLVTWLSSLRGAPGRARGVAVTAFVLVAATGAALFLLANHAQTGSALTVPYQRYLTYIRENGFRFSPWNTTHDVDVINFDFRNPLLAMGRQGVALVRLDAAAFFWPLSLLFVVFARGRATWPFWGAVATFVLVHFYLTDQGVDTYGPVHYYELLLPLVVLTTFGLHRLTGWLERLGPRARALPLSLAAASVVVALLGAFPHHAKAVRRAARASLAPEVAAARLGVTQAVVFSPRIFVPQCASHPVAHHRFWRPLSRPDLSDDIIWVNHLTVELDRELARSLGRRGWYMTWTDRCEVHLVALDDLSLAVPPPTRQWIESLRLDEGP